MAGFLHIFFKSSTANLATATRVPREMYLAMYLLKKGVQVVPE